MTEPLESRVRILEVEQGKQEIINTAVAEALNKNTAAITELTATLNRSKGAWWLMATLVGAVATITAIVSDLFKS